MNWQHLKVKGLSYLKKYMNNHEYIIRVFSWSPRWNLRLNTYTPGVFSLQYETYND